MDNKNPQRRLLIAKPRGFCAGVERAILSVEEALKQFGAPVYVKHEIVHNTFVVNRLKEKGAIFIEEIDEVPFGANLIFSAHGVSPKVREQAEERKLFQIDATCPLVTRLHSAVKRYASLGYQIVLIGHKNHVEIIGTKGEAEEVTTVVEKVEDTDKLNYSPNEKVFYVYQTTLSLFDVEAITNALLAKFPKAETLPTSSICYATTNRQMALLEIADKTDLILVIGDPKSSNSNRLKEIGEKKGIRSFLVSEASEIDPLWVKEARTIGLTAGASTPEDIVQDCLKKLRELGIDEIEEIIFDEEDVFFNLPKSIALK